MPPEPRLATHVLVSALIRRAASEGSFATVLRKGDATSGALLLVTRIRGQNVALYERLPAIDGMHSWQHVSSQVTENEQELSEYLDRRASRDPDLWVLELDVASVERLTPLLA